MEGFKMRYYALWLSLICIVVFVLQLLISEFTDLFVLDSGKIFEVWRFLTAVFLHGSFAHLLSNLFALALFGSILENYIGSRRFLYLFIGSGILANIFAVWFYPSSLGASGAIYGILGALVLIRPMMVVWVSGIPMPMFFAGLVWAGQDIVGLFIPGNIGHIAHLSGLFVGLIFGALWRNWAERRDVRESLRLNEDYVKNWEEVHMK